jgi:hypothetical protein
MADLFVFFGFVSVSEGHLIFSQKLQSLLLQCSVVKAGQNVGHTETLGDSFRLFELLFVEGDVVVLGDVVQRLEQRIFHELFALFLFR